MRYVCALVFLVAGICAAGDADRDYPYYPTLSPGVVREVSEAELCEKGSSRAARHVTTAMKASVFLRYNIHNGFSGYEVDHMVPLELGGSNDLDNLWPQPYALKYGARQKDVVENSLHRRACLGAITFAKARAILLSDWVGEYERIVHARKKRGRG